MSDDLRNWNGPALLGEVMAVLDLQLDRGFQFYAYPLGTIWLVFYNGPALKH